MTAETLPQHSPAPWRVFATQDRPFRLEIVDDRGATVAVLDVSDETGGAMEDDVTLRPDAHLMSASPTLLSGYRTILERLANEPMGDNELAAFCRQMLACANVPAETP